MISFLAFISGCTSSEEGSGNRFDPKIPGGNIGGNGKILSVSDVQLDTSTSGKITVKWTNPALYLFTDFKVHVYRRACYHESDSCTISSPATGTVSIFEVYSGQDNQFVDANGILTGQNYTYWFYVEKSNVFDTGVKTGVATPIPQSTANLSNPATFWQKTGVGIGSFVTPSTPFSAYTLIPGETSSSAPQKVTGRMAIGRGGAVMYIADTDNNRILVYAKQGALSCDSITNKNSDAYKACVFQYSGEPYVPVNVLGQPNQYSTKTCQEHEAANTIHYSTTKFISIDQNSNLPKYDKCLTKPTGVLVDGDNLLISDSGNDRVVVHKGLPIKLACDKNMIPGQTSSDNCAADFVIGKQGLSDLAVYSVLNDGESSLKNPTDLVVKAQDLYILDAGNHRVVKVAKYSDSNYFNCFPSSWKQPLCSFQAVLGQRGFREAKTFTDELSNGNITITGNTLSDATFLEKHFQDPSSMILNSQGRLLISSFENFQDTDLDSGLPMEMRARILVFDINILEGSTPSCNIASFAAFGCSASKVFGQSSFDKIPLWASGTGSFESQVSYGLHYVSNMALAGDTLVVVQPDLNKVKIWSSWTQTTSAGTPYDYDVLDPEGAVNPTNTNQNLPDLGNISAIAFDSVTSRFFITDTANRLIYEVMPYQ